MKITDEEIQNAINVGERVLIQMKYTNRNVSKEIKDESITVHETLLQTAKDMLAQRKNELWVLDSNEKQIKFGNIIKLTGTINKDVHGEYTYYEVVERGGFPIITYLMSEKGYVLPPDYSGCHLSDKYDGKSLMWISPERMPTPYDDEFVIIDEKDLPFPKITADEWGEIKREEREKRRDERKS